MPVPWIDPVSGAALTLRGDALYDEATGERVAGVRDGVPRFVSAEEDYAGSFGWQWNHWRDNRSGARGSSLGLAETIRKRTHFDEYDLAGKTILEAGMGGGDDTEVLLSYPFAEVHAFDLSTAVDRAVPLLEDERLRLSQASIYSIPYADEAFDVVYCHRVLQHTPDPREALRCLCRKVRPGGLLFIHSYQRSWRQMLEWRYKWRPLTRRLPRRWIYAATERHGARLHRLNKLLYPHPATRWLAWNLVPFYFKKPKPGMSEQELIELEKLITFDALTPRYDEPMSPDVLRSILEAEGFSIDHWHTSRVSPMYCTASR